MVISRATTKSGIGFFTEENGVKYQIKQLGPADGQGLGLYLSNGENDSAPVRKLTEEEAQTYETFITKRNRIIDLDGIASGIPLTKRNVLLILLAILIPILTSQINFGPEAPKAGYVIGIVISDLMLMVSGVISLGTGGILICILGVLAGLLEAKSIISTSMFVQFVGFCIIGYGAEATPFGKRFACWMLRTFGNKPASLVTVFLLASAFLSSFLSNTGTMIMMASICHQVMKEMDERPGKSKFAAACMLAATFGPCIGCAGFVQGSAGITLMCLSQLTSSTKAGFTITPGQFSIAGWATLLFVLPAIAFIVRKMVRFDSSDIHVLGKSYYDNELKSLGKIKGVEVRWLIYVVATIGLLIAGVDSTILILIMIVLQVCPAVGIFTPKTAFTKAVPWEIIICGVTMSQLATIINNSGLATVVSAAVAPYMASMAPFLLMFIIALVATAMAMYFVASTYAIIALCVTMTAPIIESIGLNPAIILFPTIIAINYMFGLFAQPIVTHNYRYGYWKQGTLTGVGAVVAFAAVLLDCLVCYFLVPLLWGVPLYL